MCRSMIATTITRWCKTIMCLVFIKLRLHLDRGKRIEKKVSWKKVLSFHSFGSFNKDGRETKWTDRTSSNWWKIFHPKLGRKRWKLVGHQKILLIWQFCPLKSNTKIYYSRYILKLICKSNDAKLSQFYTLYSSNCRVYLVFFYSSSTI